MRTRSFIVVLLCVGLVAMAAPVASAKPSAHAGGDAMKARTKLTAAKLNAPAEVTEGDRYKIRIKVQAVSGFRRGDLQQRTSDIFGKLVWESVKKFGVRNRRTLTYRALAGETDRETYRVVLQPRSGRLVKSKPVTVDVWHWYPLSVFDSYYSTQGVSDNEYGQFAMNGRSYKGSWYTYSTDTSWESRYTLGRNCRAMTGTFGVTDRSTDGSSATVQVLAEGVTPTYASPSLTPGVVDTPTVQLPMPYRVSIIGRNTSPEKVLAFPAAGDLLFLCTGIA